MYVWKLNISRANEKNIGFSRLVVVYLVWLECHKPTQRLHLKIKSRTSEKKIGFFRLFLVSLEFFKNTQKDVHLKIKSHAIEKNLGFSRLFGMTKVP